MADTEQDASVATRHRHLPAVDTLLRHSPELLARWGHQQLTVALRAGLALLRQRIDRGEPVDATIGSIQQSVADQLEADNQGSLQAVLNLSGTVLHTNLGRACLPESAVAAVCSAARNPSNLEFDLSNGKRGRREDHVESLICELTGAEAATVVNNNAAAVLLTLNTLAMGRQVADDGLSGDAGTRQRAGDGGADGGRRGGAVPASAHRGGGVRVRAERPPGGVGPRRDA